MHSDVFGSCFGRGVGDIKDQTSIAEVSLDGSCTILVDFLKNEEYPYVYGVISHPEGYYLAVQWNRLIKVDQMERGSNSPTWSAK